jgi:pimeloyl-ACP methyl ester carboxylesterase
LLSRNSHEFDQAVPPQGKKARARRNSRGWALMTQRLRPCLLLAAIWFGFAAGTVGAETIKPERKVFQTKDGVILIGDLYAQKQKSPTVVMFHMLKRSRQAFQPLIAPLLDHGFTIVNMDLRGHGDSINKLDKSTISYKNFGDADWLRLPHDAQTVIADLQKMPGVDMEKVAIIGSSIGANTAAIVAGNPHVKALVLLSPGDDYHGLQPEKYLRGLSKPILMFAGKGDRYSAESIEKWATLGKKFQVKVLDTRAHGNDLLTQTNSVIPETLSFLQAQLKH